MLPSLLFFKYFFLAKSLLSVEKIVSITKVSEIVFENIDFEVKVRVITL